ncbi:hypothetical protein M501DRAFT_994153, partial [Patellaria atrata CBS 101060]
MPSGQGAGTNPIHNKKPKKVQKEEDEDDKAFKAKQAAGESRRAYLSDYIPFLHIAILSFVRSNMVFIL